MKKILLILTTIALAACSSKNDVKMNEHYQAAIIAKEEARMKAIANIAAQGETGAVAAAMMLQSQGNSAHAAPNSGKDSALAWASILVPSVVQAAGIAVNGEVAKIQSNNNTTVATTNSNNNKEVAIDTNSTMASIAEVTIVNPEVVNSTTTNTTTTNTLCVTDATYSCD
jgi:hypothetical protein